jgi:uncharacterized membrane protein
VVKYLLVLVLLLAAAPLCAGTDDSQRAKDILSKPEYRGYRIEEPRRSEVERTEGKEPAQPPANNSSDRESSSGPRRSATGRTEATPRRSSSGGGGGGSGGMGTLDPGVFQAIFGIIAVIAVVFALVFLVRWLMDRKPRKKTTKAEAVDSQELEPEVATPRTARGFPELEAQLAAALKAGDYSLAALLRYKLFWLNAGWRAVTDDNEVKTWRDALRLVRSDDMRREIRRLLFLVESVRYGKHRPDAQEFNEWRAKLEGIDHRSVLS